MAKQMSRLFIPFLIIILPFAGATLYTDNAAMGITTLLIAITVIAVYHLKLYNTDFDPDSKAQKSVYFLVMVIITAFAFFLCAVSIESDWLFAYPLEGSVDDYGCYPQMFDAFQKGQLHIDTDYDLSVLEALENPYDTAARRAATGERYGVTWDRAYFNGKLYSYFGAAPVFLIYYPVYFLTGAVPSDALAAAILAQLSSIFLMLLLWELCKRLERRVPFLLVILGGSALTFASLIWPTLTNANFYHLAVMSGIMAVSAFFWLVLKAEEAEDGVKRKLLFALSGLAVGAVAASRPNMVIYCVISLPLLFSVIRKRPYGTKSLFGDIASFAVPMIFIGILIMLYNNARFGSPFDFGSSYQLTLADTSTYSFSLSLVFPAFYHYFFSEPLIDKVFPYIHISANRMEEYGVDRLVYVDKTIGSLFIPATWGCFLLPLLSKHKRKLITALLAVGSVVFMAVFDMNFAGVHLRYASDVMFILGILGVYLLITAVGSMKKGSMSYVVCYSAVTMIFAATVLTVIPLCLDNERDMIYKYHREFYDMLKGAGM